MIRTPDEILEGLYSDGEMPEAFEVEDLCVAAKEGDWALEKLAALERALERDGWSILDLTTDDDAGTVLELVPPEVAA